MNMVILRCALARTLQSRCINNLYNRSLNRRRVPEMLPIETMASESASTYSVCLTTLSELGEPLISVRHTDFPVGPYCFSVVICIGFV